MGNCYDLAILKENVRLVSAPVGDNAEICSGLKPDYSRMLSHTEKQMIALEMESSAVCYFVWFVVKEYGLCDLFKREAGVCVM